MRLPGRPEAGDRGSITLMMLALFVVLIALAGIVIDGGAKLNQAENANAIAQEAARAGAGMVNQANAYANGRFTVDPAQAVAAARLYLASNGYSAANGYLTTVTPVGTDSIQVTVTVTSRTRVLSIVGVASMTSRGSAIASLVTGVTGPGQ
jgi:Flp pilus assembly protein TadG